MASRVCIEPGCPVIIGQGRTRCTAHARAADKARGSKQQRGYDAAHQRLRNRVQQDVNRGVVRCVTCGARLLGRMWDLGHNKARDGYIGPQCIPCNRGHKDTR